MLYNLCNVTTGSIVTTDKMLFCAVIMNLILNFAVAVTAGSVESTYFEPFIESYLGS